MSTSATGEPQRRLLSVVIPVFNERNTVGEVVRRARAVELPVDLEVIAVDDGSTDGTDKILAALEDSTVRVLTHRSNRGKGACIRTALEHLRGDLVLVQDADLEYDPADYMKLLEPIVENRADVVYGSRFMGGEPHRVLYFWHTLGNKFLTFLSNMFTNLNLTDMEVCYKAFRKSVLDRIDIKCNRFGFEPEVTAKVARLKPRLRIYEVGVAYYGRSYEEGKKITWVDGIKAVLTIVRFRFFD